MRPEIILAVDANVRFSWTSHGTCTLSLVSKLVRRRTTSRVLAWKGCVCLVSAMVSPACHHRAPVLGTPDRRGEASYRALASIETPAVTQDSAEESISLVHPFEANAPPEYPASALRAGCNGGLIPMRLHIGINGRVTDVQDTPGRPALTDFCHEAFREAVREALAGWRYVPAYRVRRVASDPPSRPVITFGREGDVTAVRDANAGSHTERMPLGVDLDYEFIFQVVNGIGAVRAN